MNFKYSIIIPHYDDIPRLERLINSIPLKRKDIEVLIVDDCSPSYLLLNELKEKYPLLLWLSTTKNSGAGAARNIGMAHATGEYILFADSDDEFVENAFDIFDKYANDDIELVYFLSEAIQEVDGTVSNRADRSNLICFEYLKEKSPERLLKLQTEHVVPVAKIYQRQSLKRLGTSFEETKVANDVLFNAITAVQLKKIKVVGEVVYRIYRRDGSLTANKSAEAFLQRVMVACRLIAKLKALGVKTNTSGEGFILRSITYGPIVMVKTTRHLLKSDLQVNFFSLFNLKKWLDYIAKSYRNHLEKSKAKKNSNHPRV